MRLKIIKRELDKDFLVIKSMQNQDVVIGCFDRKKDAQNYKNEYNIKWIAQH